MQPSKFTLSYSIKHAIVSAELTAIKTSGYTLLAFQPNKRDGEKTAN